MIVCSVCGEGEVREGGWGGGSTCNTTGRTHLSPEAVVSGKGLEDIRISEAPPHFLEDQRQRRVSRGPLTSVLSVATAAGGVTRARAAELVPPRRRQYRQQPPLRQDPQELEVLRSVGFTGPARRVLRAVRAAVVPRRTAHTAAAAPATPAASAASMAVVLVTVVTVVIVVPVVMVRVVEDGGSVDSGRSA